MSGVVNSIIVPLFNDFLLKTKFKCTVNTWIWSTCWFVSGITYLSISFFYFFSNIRNIKTNQIKLDGSISYLCILCHRLKIDNSISLPGSLLGSENWMPSPLFKNVLKIKINVPLLCRCSYLYCIWQIWPNFL